MNSKRINLMVALLATVTINAKDLSVRITWPLDGAQEPWRFCLQATASDRKARVYFVIHPLEWTDYYVQPEPTQKPDGTFKTIGYVAEDLLGIFDGKRLEIMAVANPKVPLREGLKLRSWPKAEAVSAVIEVVRSDLAAGACPTTGPTKAQVAPNTARITPPGAVAPSAGSGQVQPSRAAERFERPFPMTIISDSLIASTWLYVGMFSLFTLLATSIDESRKLLDLLCGWFVNFGGFVRQFARFAGGQPVTTFSELHSGCRRSSKRLWRSAGFEGSLKHYWIHLLSCPVLAIGLLLSSGSEAYVVHSRLTLIFPPDLDRQSGLLDAASSAPSASNTAAILPSSSAVPPQPNPLSTLVKNVWNLLSRGGLWLIAIGLTALQAIGGTLVLWNLTGVEPLEMSPLGLLRQRPTPCLLFLILDLALTVLAAIGGSEYSPDGINLAVPATVAAAITFVLPLFTAYALHYLLEAAGECLGPVTAALSVAGIVIGAAMVLFGWTTLLLLSIASLCVAFSAACASGGILAAFVWLAISFGSAWRSINTVVCNSFGNWRKRHAGQILPVAATTALCLLAGLAATYYFVN